MKILIAEDEKIERESLVHTIRESMLEIDEIIVVENGMLLVKQYDICQADILLVDINMPVMDGLTAIAQIRKKYPDQSIGMLVLTSYDHFLYAQEAIRLGIDEFLLKPLKPEMLVIAISKLIINIRKKRNDYTQTMQLVEKYDEMRSTVEMQCLYGIMTNMDEQRLDRLFQLLHYRVESAICYIFPAEYGDGLRVLKQQLNDCGYYCLVMNYRSRLVLFVLYCGVLTSNDEETIVTIIHTILPDLYIVNSTTKHHINHFYPAYLEASQTYWKLYETEKDKETSEIDNDVVIQQLLDAKHNHDMNKIPSIIHGYLLGHWKHYHFIDRNAVNSMLINLILKLKEAYPEIEYHDDVKWQYSDSSLLQDIEYDVTTYIDQIFNLFTMVSNRSKNYLIQKALSFIAKHYQQPIGLDDVANELKVTPAYVSRLLSKSEYPSFSELISDFRIEESKKLLRQNYRMKEIYFKVGFQSQSYFTKIFRKKVGMTPKEYRDKYLSV